MALNPYKSMLYKPPNLGVPGGTGAFAAPTTNTPAPSPTTPYKLATGVPSPPTIGRIGSGPFNPTSITGAPFNVGAATSSLKVPTPGSNIPGANGIGGAPIPLQPPGPHPAVNPTFQPPAPQTMTMRANPAPAADPVFEPAPSNVTMRANPSAASDPVFTPSPEAPTQDPYKVSNGLAGIGDVSSFDKGPMTDVGAKYHDSLLQDLTTADNPYVKSIREGAQRLSDKNSYGATRQAEEAMGASGIQAGTSQYNRALAKAAGTANEANLNLQNNAAGVQRDFYQNALKGADKYEGDMFDRAKGERNNAQDVAKYGDQRGDLQHASDETTRLEKKGDALAFVNSIADPKAREAARLAVQRGEDPRTIGASIFDQYGGVNKQFQSASPGSVEAQGLQDRVRAAMTGQINPVTKAPYTEAEISAKASEIGLQSLQSEYAPVTQGAKDVVTNTAMEKARTLPPGQFLTQEEFDAAAKAGAVPRVDMATAAMDGNKVAAFLASNPGGIVSIGGKQYRVLSGDTVTTGRSQYLNQPRRTDVTKVESAAGVEYIYDGAFHKDPPKAIGPVKIFPWQ